MSTDKAEKVNKETGEISPTVSIINDEMLAEIQSFDDALALVNSVLGGEVVESDKVLGTGFGVADEKNAYVGIPFIVMRADKNLSDMLDPETGEKRVFWSLHCVTRDGRKVIINDGGTGIGAQMTELYRRHPEMTGKPLLVKKGLRVSNYVHPVHGPSVTYYLDTSAVV